MRSSKIVLILALLAAIFVAGSASAVFHDNQQQSRQPEAVGLIVKFKPNVTVPETRDGAAAMATGVRGLDALNTRFNVTAQSKLLAAGQTSDPKAPFANTFVLETPDNADLEAMAREYSALDAVEYACPNYVAEPFDFPIDPDPIELPPTPPNDTWYGVTWPLQNNGTGHYSIIRLQGDNNDTLAIVFGTAGADIHWEEVWDDPPEQADAVVVAILDTGVDTDHPDLAAHMWVNDDEIPNNGIDDDNNGYIDDVYGWDYCGNDDMAMMYEQWEDNDPTDAFGHGTHCAGIVAAVTNNHEGIAGIVPDAKIMALKFFPLMSMDRAVRGIMYAVENGADVINMSWGLPWAVPVLEEALEYARSRGVVLVAASGNDQTYAINYPAAYPQTIAVGASDCNDEVTWFSTYNEFIDVVAPGRDILSLRADETDMYAGDGEPNVRIIGDHYYLADGTSMASPHVAGVAAYLRSVSPGLTPDATEEIIKSSADDFVDPYGTGGNYPGWDMYSGWGRVNVESALAAVNDVRAIITSPSNYDVLTGQVTVTGSADGGDCSGYVLDYGEGDSPTSWTQITSSSSHITNGTLGTWNTAGLEGLYLLRLTAGTDNVATARVFVVGGTVAEITTPAAYDTVRGSVEITGSALCPDFAYSVLEYKYYSAMDWETLATISTPVYNDKLADWFVGTLYQGPYYLRLLVYSNQGLEQTVMTGVIVFPYSGWKAELEGTPARSATFGDFNGDGNNEILIGTSDTLYAFEADGTPAQTSVFPSLPAGDYRAVPAIGKLDNDNVDDAVIVAANGDLHIIRSNASDVTVQTGMTLDVSAFAITADSPQPGVTLFDMNGDGIDEIILYRKIDWESSNTSYARPHVYNADGSDYGVTFPAQSGSRGILAADLDGDGYGEIYHVSGGKWLQAFDYQGSTIGTLSLVGNTSSDYFLCRSLSAVDIDGDGTAELIVFGLMYSSEQDDSYMIFAIDADMSIMSGWPHETGISNGPDVLNPVFADLDGDGTLEYGVSYYGISYTYISMYNLDGSPFLSGAGPDGSFAVTSQTGIGGDLIIGDADDNDEPDILIGCVEHPVTAGAPDRIEAFTPEAEIVSNFPMITDPEAASMNIFSVPVIGDVNGDGFVDLIWVTTNGGLVFLERPGVAFNPDHTPCPMWRYNRRLNGNYIPNPVQPTAFAITGDEATTVPTEFALAQNYPNPFNPVTQIQFSIPRKAQVSLEIYNIAGRRVAVLADREFEAGTHSVTWDASERASGVYFDRLRSADFTETRKMVLLK